MNKIVHEMDEHSTRRNRESVSKLIVMIQFMNETYSFHESTDFL